MLPVKGGFNMKKAGYNITNKKFKQLINELRKFTTLPLLLIIFAKQSQIKKNAII